MNPHNRLRFRPANSNDIATLADFNCRLAMETEGKTLDAAIVRSGVTRGLNVGDEVQYFVAEAEGNIVGQIMLTREWSDWRDGWMAWLQSVYVVADFRGQGIFRGLLNHAKQQLRSQPDVVCLRLYVEQENETAIATYRRLDFEDPGYRVLEMPLR